ncbi:MAG TPA: hypothetical protein VF273_00470 [Pelobium sp.]
MKISSIPMCFERNVAKFLLFNFVVLAAAGTLLRYLNCFSLSGVNYQFLLHSHSHFAFAGWMFLSIAFLSFHQFKHPQIISKPRFNLIFWFTIFVSFGMLASFFLSGYKLISIVFSTLFVFIGYSFVVILFKSKMLAKTSPHAVVILLKSALFFLVLSSLGPFFLGYLQAKGFKNIALQQNSIYFYLHFQLNGFMQLSLLALFFKRYLKQNLVENRRITFYATVFSFSTLPLYAMFILWQKPAIWVYVLVFVSAIIHFSAWLMLLYKLKPKLEPLSFLAKIALIAIGLQFFFQILIGIPIIGDWAFVSRNLIIGYIHLLTLGSLSPLIIDLLIQTGVLTPSARLNYFFILSVGSYLVLLFGSSFLTIFKIYIPHLPYYLFVSNLWILVIAVAYLIRAFNKKGIYNAPHHNFLIK